jgi:ADP-ribose pyrophosphatase YjhB (NUDIX family)
MWRSLPGAGVLVVKDERVLMVRQERSGRYRWELPSGLVDAGEIFEQAAERERLAQTGVAVSQGENGGDDKQREQVRHSVCQSRDSAQSGITPLFHQAGEPPGLEPRTR